MWMEMHSRIFACLQTSYSCNCCYNGDQNQATNNNNNNNNQIFFSNFFLGVFSELNSSGCCCCSYQFKIEIIEL
jgi:hypothetical protein